MLRVGLPSSLATLSPLRSPAITTVAIAVCVSFSPSITDPHASGRIIACAHYTHTASLCKHSFRWPGGCSLMLRFDNHLADSIRSTCPFCVHSRSLSRYASLMLRSSTPSFTSFTQLSFLMANAVLRSSGVNML
ncbi:hypothetical protein [Petrimonas sp.]|uniref:hypothetical protein n=1 Tax=Petrimonas sp. TaxID=2023866 RepID=UPI002FCB8940